MNPIGAAESIVGASGAGGVDWEAACDAAQQLTTPGTLDRSAAVREHYGASIRAAKREISSVSGISFDLPRTVTVLNRHHWIERVAGMLESGFEPLAADTGPAPAVTGSLNTASVAGSVAYLSRRVLGQYDPHLFTDSVEPGLYIVHPNVAAGATELSVPEERFRRWIAFHEVAHAAEFGAAPWLRSHLQAQVQTIVKELATGSIPRKEYGDLNRAMTAVEGYAELLMDEAFDRPSAELRRKLDDRREPGGPLGRLISRVLGLDIKREQYETGRAFFDVIAAERGVEGAGTVWADPANLPSETELDSPRRWLQRVPPRDEG